MEQRFKVNLERLNVNVYNLNKLLNIHNDGVIISESSRATVDFTIEFDIRDWGVASIDYSINEIELIIDWGIEKHSLSDNEINYLVNTIGGDELNDEVEGIITLNIKNSDKYHITVNTKLNDNTLTIDTLDIDFKENTIELT
jgi:hypothetical protein